MSTFGRLEIFWPDAPVGSFILPHEVVAIGRSTGNDLVIDRNGVSRYHAKIIVAGSHAELEDLESVNGIYVDGMKLDAGQTFHLRGGEEIQIADVRFVYHPPEQLEATKVTDLSDTTQQMITEQLSVSVTTPEMVVIPGSHVQVAVMIENLSNEERRYTLSLEGVPVDWVRLERRDILLDPQEQTRALVNFKPLRRSETKTGDYPVTYTVTPKDDPEKAVSVESIVTVGAFSGYGVVMGTVLIENRQPFRLFVHNHGNGLLNMNFRGVDPNNHLDFAIDPPAITLEPGQRQNIVGTVRLKQTRLFGNPRRYRYDIISTSQDAAHFQAPVSGLYVSKPPLPSWAATLAIPIVAIAVIGLIVLLISVFTGEDLIIPSVQSFQAVSNEVVLGEPAQLTWNVADAESIQLEYAQADQTAQVIVLNDAQATDTYQLDLAASGVYTVRLVVENTGGIKEEIIILQVLPAVLEFRTEPATLLKHVTQDVEIIWQVVGAIESPDTQEPLISLSGSEDPIMAEGLPFSGSQTMSLRPDDSVNMTLQVIGRDETTNSRTLVLAVEEPQCTARLEEITLYQGPGQSYEVARTIDTPDFSISPLGRSPNSTWMQILYISELVWVRAEAFTCDGFEAGQLDIAEDIPALPSPTPSPSPTTTPSTTPSPTLTPTPTNTPTPSATPTPR